jgi:hypothetical protein
MVDLQRRIAAKQNTLCSWMQDDAGNSDANASRESNCRQKFSAMESSENFIRSKSTQLERSVHVLLEPALFLEFRDETDGFIG